MNIDVLAFVKDSKIRYEKASESYRDYKKRDMYSKLKGRLNVLYGLRGAGKTTLLFQKFIDSENRIFLNGEEISLARKDLNEIINAVHYLFGEEIHVFIDEINSIKNWQKVIKVTYDKFPKMKFYLTGSSSLNIQDSKKTLARRAEYYNIKPLSFREYLYLKYNLKLKQFREDKDLQKNAIHYEIYFKELIKDLKTLDIVEEYIENNLVYLLEKNQNTLKDLVEKSIMDISRIKNIKTDTLSKFERMILILSASSKMNYETLSKDLELSKSKVGEMLDTLEKIGIIKRLYPYKKGATIARKEWKYYFTVPAIRKLYAKTMLVPDDRIKGYMFEDIFVSNFDNLYFSDIDFIWKNYLIEIGSRNKGFEQFKKVKNKLEKIIVYNGLDTTAKEDIMKIPFYIWYSFV